MTVHTVNPDSTVLNQLEDQWEKIVAIPVWKLARDGVRITLQDLESFAKETAAGDAVLFTHGHYDSFDFKIVTAQRAQELAEWDAKQRGTG